MDILKKHCVFRAAPVNAGSSNTSDTMYNVLEIQMYLVLFHYVFFFLTVCSICQNDAMVEQELMTTTTQNYIK